jgi:hypothetical protein
MSVAESNTSRTKTAGGSKIYSGKYYNLSEGKCDRTFKNVLRGADENVKYIYINRRMFIMNIKSPLLEKKNQNRLQILKIIFLIMNINLSQLILKRIIINIKIIM